METYRDLLSGIMDLYMNTASNRMNEIMKVLTIMSTIFIPMTFIAGIYGMNFENMPELHYKWSYPLAWLVMHHSTRETAPSSYFDIFTVYTLLFHALRDSGETFACSKVVLTESK